MADEETKKAKLRQRMSLNDKNYTNVDPKYEEAGSQGAREPDSSGTPRADCTREGSWPPRQCLNAWILASGDLQRRDSEKGFSEGGRQRALVGNSKHQVRTPYCFGSNITGITPTSTPNIKLKNQEDERKKKPNNAFN